MTLLQLRTFVMDMMDDPDNDILAGGTTTYDEYINEAYRSCYAFISRLFSGFATKTATGTISDGDTTLAIPADFLSIYKLGSKEEAADAYQWAEHLDYERDGDQYVSSDTDRPQYFSFDIPNGNFNLHPEADQDYLYKLIYRKKIVASDAMSLVTDSPDLIPLDYHRWIAYEATIDLMNADDRNPMGIIKLQQKLEKRMRSEYVKMQQASPQYMGGWDDRRVERAAWGYGD